MFSFALVLKNVEYVTFAESLTLLWPGTTALKFAKKKQFLFNNV